jgi:hypothetical protein
LSASLAVMMILVLSTLIYIYFKITRT